MIRAIIAGPWSSIRGGKGRRNPGDGTGPQLPLGRTQPARPNRMALSSPAHSPLARGQCHSNRTDRQRWRVSPWRVGMTWASGPICTALRKGLPVPAAGGQGDRGRPVPKAWITAPGQRPARFPAAGRLVTQRGGAEPPDPPSPAPWAKPCGTARPRPEAIRHFRKIKGMDGAARED